MTLYDTCNFMTLLTKNTFYQDISPVSSLQPEHPCEGLRVQGHIHRRDDDSQQ